MNNLSLAEFLNGFFSKICDSKIFCYSDLSEYFGYSDKKKLSNQDLREISEAIMKLGYAVEPDIKYKPFTARKTDKLIVFKANSQPSTLSSQYKFNYILVHIISMFAAYDYEVPASEWAFISEFIDTRDDLDENEKLRLHKCVELNIKQYLEMVKLDESSVGKLEDFLKNIQKYRNKELMNLIYDTILSDFQITPREIILLKKVYKILEIESKLPVRDILDHHKNKKKRVLRRKTKLKDKKVIENKKPKKSTKSEEDIDSIFAEILLG